MGYDKAEVIRSIYEEQAKDAEDLAETAHRETHEHEGAAQCLVTLGKQMPSFADTMQKQIAADESMSPETAQKVLVYTKSVIAHFQNTCVENSRAARKSKLRAEGQISMLAKLAEIARKKGTLAVSSAKRRAEVNAEARERKEAEDAAAEAAADTKSGFDQAEKAGDAKEEATKIMADVNAKAAKKAAKAKTKKPTPKPKTTKPDRTAKIAAAAKKVGSRKKK